MLPTLAGPIYTFGIIWIGFLLLGKLSVRLQSVGFALVVSSMPFSRILTPLFGGGDTIFALKRLGVEQSIAWPLVLAVVLALLIPPVIRVYRKIGRRRRLLWLVGLLLIPFLLVGAVVFAVLQNTLLKNCVLDQTWVLGSPVLLTVWLLVSTVTILLLFKHMTTFLVPVETDDGKMEAIG